MKLKSRVRETGRKWKLGKVNNDAATRLVKSPEESKLKMRMKRPFGQPLNW